MSEDQNKDHQNPEETPQVDDTQEVQHEPEDTAVEHPEPPVVDPLEAAAAGAAESLSQQAFTDDDNEAGGDEDDQIDLSDESYLEKDTQNVVQSKPVDSALPDKIGIVPLSFIHALNHTAKEIRHLSELIPKLDLANTEAGRAWRDALMLGMDNLMPGDAFKNSLFREGSEYHQVIEEEGVRIAAGRPTMGKQPGQEGELLTGTRAMNQIMGALGLGSMLQIPLWHSGIWVSIKAPTDSELLILDQRLADEKVSLGKQSNGFVFSNTSVYIHNHLINFILDHIYDSTLKDSSVENLRNMIRSTDLPTLIWGMACAIYPKGYPYRRPCVANPANCQHIAEAMLNLARLSWTDRNALTPVQRKHMINRRAKHTNEIVLGYQMSHVCNEKRTVDLSPLVQVVLKVPSLDEYIVAGFEWIEGLAEMVEKTFGSTLKGQDRDNHIYGQGNLTYVRQYTHWVDKVLVRDTEEDDFGIIEDKDTLNEILSVISGSDEVRSEFFKAVARYIDDSTMSVIGIPRYNCPKCGRPQGHDEGHKFIIPLDVANVFFTLQRQRTLRAAG